VSTSANPQGQLAATSAAQVQAYFGQAIDVQTPGTVGDAAKPSEIRYLISGEIVREG
jgi:L-threonylcarbamoyladenylate synthase